MQPKQWRRDFSEMPRGLTISALLLGPGFVTMVVQQMLRRYVRRSEAIIDPLRINHLTNES